MMGRSIFVPVSSVVADVAGEAVLTVRYFDHCAYEFLRNNTVSDSKLDVLAPVVVQDFQLSLCFKQGIVVTLVAIVH